MRDFFAFRRMVTPVIIKFVYWILTLVAIIGGLVGVIGGENAGERFVGLLTLIIGPLVIRIYAEILILAFRINETLTEIKNNTQQR